MAIKIGVIAEDLSDVHVITEILAKYLERNMFSVKHFVGQGCGKLRAKCHAWIDNLNVQGCEHIFVFHDLDRNNEDVLRREIAKRTEGCRYQGAVVIIPSEELEAWLLADIEAVKSVFSITDNVKDIADTEAVPSPKEFLEKLVRRLSSKIYINTVHNRQIAARTNIDNLVRCRSYKPFNSYMVEKVV